MVDGDAGGEGVGKKKVDGGGRKERRDETRKSEGFEVAGLLNVWAPHHNCQRLGPPDEERPRRTQASLMLVWQFSSSARLALSEMVWGWMFPLERKEMVRAILVTPAMQLRYSRLLFVYTWTDLSET